MPDSVKGKKLQEKIISKFLVFIQNGKMETLLTFMDVMHTLHFGIYCLKQDLTIDGRQAKFSHPPFLQK